MGGNEFTKSKQTEACGLTTSVLSTHDREKTLYFWLGHSLNMHLPRQVKAMLWLNWADAGGL